MDDPNPAPGNSSDDAQPTGGWEDYDYERVFTDTYYEPSATVESTDSSDTSDSDSGGSSDDDRRDPVEWGGSDTSDGAQSSWGLGSWVSSAIESVSSYFSGPSTQDETAPTDTQQVDNENSGDADEDGEEPGLRQQSIELTDHFEHGTIGHAFNATARIFQATVGENESDAPIPEWLAKPETQDLMAQSMENREAVYQFAGEEQETWEQDTTGNLGARIGASLPPEIRVPAMDAVESATRPVDPEAAQDDLTSYGS